MELFHSPAGAQQWRPKDNGWANSVPEPFGPGKTHPSMLTSDLALRFDPIYEKITRRWLDHPDELADAFARAWFKLIHRDMGPVDLYRGPLVPSEHLLWQDPIPAETASTITDADVATLKGQLAESGLTVAQLVSTAWAASSSFRGSDKRGGANGGRIRPQPQAGWRSTSPTPWRRSSPSSRRSRRRSTRPVATPSRSPTSWCSAATSASRRLPRRRYDVAVLFTLAAATRRRS